MDHMTVKTQPHIGRVWNSRTGTFRHGVLNQPPSGFLGITAEHRDAWNAAWRWCRQMNQAAHPAATPKDA